MIKKPLVKSIPSKKFIGKDEAADMEPFEKVEKLRERADVTYEEAKEALEASNWDLLDAMVYLEKNGKTKAPEKETYSTSYEDQEQFVSVKDKVQEQKKSSDGFFTKLGKLIKIAVKKCLQNYFVVTRNEKEILKVPLLAVVCGLFFFWQWLLIAAVIGLFLDYRYSIRGRDEMKEVNEAMDKASEFAGKVKDEFEKM